MAAALYFLWNNPYRLLFYKTLEDWEKLNMANCFYPAAWKYAAAVFFMFVVNFVFAESSEPRDFSSLTYENNVPPEVGLSPDLASLLGLTIAEIFDLMGPPSEIFSLRGGKEAEDLVVFFYDNRIYLFWYLDRVWQIRADSFFEGKVFSFVMGSQKDDIVKELGPPAFSDDASCIYNITVPGFIHPVRGRFFFENNLLHDFYLFRGDF